MGETCAIEIILTAPENLCFILQAAESGRVQHPIAIDLEWSAVVTGIDFAFASFGIKSPVKSVRHFPDPKVSRGGSRGGKRRLSLRFAR